MVVRLPNELRLVAGDGMAGDEIVTENRQRIAPVHILLAIQIDGVIEHFQTLTLHRPETLDTGLVIVCAADLEPRLEREIIVLVEFRGNNQYAHEKLFLIFDGNGAIETYEAGQVIARQLKQQDRRLAAAQDLDDEQIQKRDLVFPIKNAH